MSELLALAERCEKAAGPDRELGFEILLACGWRKTCVGNFYGPLYYWNDGAGCSYPEDRLSCPTKSVDAALSLVPSSLSAVIRTPCISIEDDQAHAEIQRWHPDPDDTFEIVADACGYTTPTAICGAVLRARSSLTDDGDRK